MPRVFRMDDAHKNEELEEALDCLPFPVGIQNRSWRLTYQNRRHRELFGEAVGRTCYSMSWNRDEPCAECPFETGQNMSRCGTVNAIGQARVRASILGDSGERVLEVFDRFGEDEPMVAALKEAFERARTAMLVVDSNGKILGANGSAGALWNSSKEELDGASVFELFTEETARLLEDAACNFDSNSIRIEGVQRKGFPKPTLEVESSSISGSDEPLTLILSRKESEANMAQHAFLTEQTEKAEAFVHTVAHDLRTPLVSLKGYASFLKKELGNADPRHKSFAEHIVTQADRLDSLLEALLDFAKAGRGRKPVKPLDIEASAHAAWHDLTALVRQAGATLQVEGPLPEVFMSPVSMSQILYNLFANSLKFRREGVAPAIRLRSLSSSNNVSPAFICLVVEDNGIGIPPEDKKIIFDLFRQGSHGNEGTGVGLAIVQRIVESCGGKIWVESEPGQWSKFYMNLPAARVIKSEETQL